MRNLVLTLLLLAGCSGHANPDPAVAEVERRERALSASSGGRAALVRRHAERPVTAYDVKDLLCPDPPPTEEDGVLVFREEEPDGCVHLDLDQLVGLVRFGLGDAHGQVLLAGTDVDVLVVEGSWSAHEQVGADLDRRAADLRSCRRCPRHGRPGHGQGAR